MATDAAPRGPFRGSHLRQVSTGSSSAVEIGKRQLAKGPPPEDSVVQPPEGLAPQCFGLSIHEETVSKEDVLLNISPNHVVREGDLLQLTAPVDGNTVSGPKRKHKIVEQNQCLYFHYNPVAQEVLSKLPTLQISVSRRIATAFGFEKGTQLLVSTADRVGSQATHVEIVFRDQYLPRADMWRLIVSVLGNTCIHKGQKVEYMGSIRAYIKAIFVQGRKVQSALFHPSTKPIFRSESARYVLFIQMSKEMWDFDAEGSGEIMFDKVINGFLPELFKKWTELKVKHLVSVVLFTRMTYEEHTASGANVTRFNSAKDQAPKAEHQKLTKDFYRVIVSDMASGEWADILNQLKKEFKVFLRDISIRRPDTGDHLPLGEGLSSALADTPKHVIAGHPSAASCGNLLEAINLASSQFSSDYIDRDLVRTGVSIVVISPGAGVFEVDYNLLVATTENLIDNGVGIDLVCLSQMPLHSVPLFKYRPPPTAQDNAMSARMINTKDDEVTPTGSFAGEHSSGTPPSTFGPDDSKLQKFGLQDKLPKETWSYGIPHWIDISFWTSSSGKGNAETIVLKKPKEKSSFDTPQHKTFIPRVKMYELQMMGVMENAISDISIPRLSRTYHRATSQVHSSINNATFTSPKFINRLPISNSFGSQGHQMGPQISALSTSLASDHSGTERSLRPQFQWMDDYDDLVFRHPLVAKKRYRKFKSGKVKSKRDYHRYSPSLLGTSAGTRDSSSIKDRVGHVRDSYLDMEGIQHRPSHLRSVQQGTLNDKHSRDKSTRPKTETTRQISFGPRGFSAKAVASTEVTTKHGEGSLLSRGLRSGLSAKPTGQSSTTPTKSRKISDAYASQEAVVSNPEMAQSSESETQQSRPIPIRNSTVVRVTNDRQPGPRPYDAESRDIAAGGHLQYRLAALQDLREHEEDAHPMDSDGAAEIQPAAVALSPSTTLAPWLTILNPSNPSKTKAALASRLGRWQHVFPRPLKTSQIKWKSLCSPAAVPLTTEDFPSAEQLAEEYESTTYDIFLPENAELSETPRSLVAEILAFRLSRGFQLVVGPRVVESTGISSLQTLNVFDQRILEEIGTPVFLSRGGTLHRISRIDANRIEIKQLFRYRAETEKGPGEKPMLYKPFICSMLAQEYDLQEISIAPHRSNFDWKAIDAFIAGHERPQAQDFVESLRPWRARFVLIPVDAPSSARRRQRSDEDDEEEIRLEGIRKLTQIWQRFRYIPSDERRYQAPLRNRKDTNPLDIMYQTRNPSAIIAAELENVAEGGATGRPVQLLPESDLFQRANFKIAGLAEIIQSEKGVRMLDRRWHLRLHYNCFIGFELTSWLLQNFRDVDTRDEAVDLGNELMKSGMFKHVEQRHNFRDGNYFYQISDEFRTPRPESRGWFGRGKPSVPSTPVSEDVPKEIPATSRSRSSSGSNPAEDNDPTTPTGRQKQLGVALSKSLIYDVDHRKRSYRPELINLHYDRLHNPDSCYHIRVEWMNTTPKLIQDAVVSWATAVDRFGLRLVEVPLGEASSITSMHPFRAPDLVKLAKSPPERQPQSYFDTTSFAPQLRTEKNLYQKAIMKRFNFVLDFEAASDFPSDVHVTYSWGRPDYRYPQYIHRSGHLIAQITDNGDFLILANRLYNNRNTVHTSYQETHRANFSTGGDQDRGPGIFRSSPHRGNHGPARPSHASPHDSPYNSPSIRATLDVPQSANQSRGLSPNPSFPRLIDPTRPASTNSYTTPEATKKDFEAFCTNVEALAAFYDEVLSQASTPGPNTPFMGSKTPSKAPDSGFNESNIPALALPGSVVEKSPSGGGGKKVEGKTRVVEKQGPAGDGASPIDTR